MRPSRPLLQAVAPSIDDPIELLRACHDKVRRFSGLTLRLRDHLTTLPAAQPDAQAQEAAQAILRYFDLAAPLHHDDEERDLFPALRTLGHAALNEVMDSLEAEHGHLGGLWQDVAPWLRRIAAGQAAPPPADLGDFAALYPAHAQREEDEVYPFATQLRAEQIQAISAAMVARRTHN
jgi:hemerythrin-like domain-containing protein